MNWNDLKYVLAVHQHGSLPAAAQALGVNHTTVWRRIQALEKDMAAQLFINDRQQYRLTDLGREVIHYAQNANDNLDAIDRLARGQSQELKGVIRLSVPGQAANDLLPEILSEFQQNYPQIRFEITFANRHLDLEKREADIAIRGAKKAPDNLIGRCLGRIHWSLFAHPKFCSAKNMTLNEIKQLPLIGFENTGTPAGQWFAGQFGDIAKTVTCSEPEHAQGFAEAGMGVALLPSYIDTSLQPIYTLPEAYGVDLWLLTHKEMRTSLKLKTFWDFLLEKMASHTLVQQAVSRASAAE